MATLIKKFMEDAQKGGLHILEAQVRKDGEVVDEWTRFPAKPRFETYSVSKTFVGVGAGIAIRMLTIMRTAAVRSVPQRKLQAEAMQGLF
ncbi:MAG: hypothetical protein ACOYBE_10925 [Blautia sp.]|jgi:CubicO group peptidase (beta-lactamase class C family)